MNASDWRHLKNRNPLGTRTKECWGREIKRIWCGDQDRQSWVRLKHAAEFPQIIAECKADQCDLCLPRRERGKWWCMMICVFTSSCKKKAKHLSRRSPSQTQRDAQHPTFTQRGAVASRGRVLWLRRELIISVLYAALKRAEIKGLSWQSKVGFWNITDS